MFKLAWNQSVRMISEMNSCYSLWEQEARGQDSWESTLNWLQSEAWKQPVAGKRCQYCRDCRELPTGHSKNCPNCPFVPALCQTLHRDCHKMCHLPSLDEKQTLVCTADKSNNVELTAQSNYLWTARSRLHTCLLYTRLSGLFSLYKVKRIWELSWVLHSKCFLRVLIVC